MPLFRPSLVVNFRLRFDEALLGAKLKTPVDLGESLSEPLKGTSGPTAQPPAMLSKGDGKTSFVFGRVPKDASVEFPGHRQAGQFSINIDFKDMPIDPRLVRAAAVEIHLGTIPTADAAAGAKGLRPDGSSYTVLKTRSDDGSPNEATLVMVGIVDEWDVTHDSHGSVVHVRGRDMRGVLIDQTIEVAPGNTDQLLDKLDYTKTIDKLVGDILAENPLFGDFQVLVNPEEWDDGKIPTLAGESTLRHRQKAKGGGSRHTPNSSGGATSFWDLIVKFCYLVGAIPYFKGDKLLIRPARTLFDENRPNFDPARIPTPFAGGAERSYDPFSKTSISPALRHRRMVYGRDIESLHFNRKFGGHSRPKVVRCVGAVDPEATKKAGKLQYFEGMWPPPPKKQVATKVAPGGDKSQTEILNIKAPQYAEPTKLIEIARGIYEEIGRGEIGGSVETANLSSFGGGNPDPDLLRMQPGDGVEFLVDSTHMKSGSPLVSTLTNMESASFDEAVEAIKARIGDAGLATAIVTATRGGSADIQKFFRVQTVKYSWSGSGLKVSFDFQNYYVPRNQIDNASPTPGSVKTTSTIGDGGTKAEAPGVAAPTFDPRVV